MLACLLVKQTVTKLRHCLLSGVRLGKITKCRCCQRQHPIGPIVQGLAYFLLDILKTTLRGGWELPGTKALLKPLHKLGVR
ncbi:hypothetical protein DPMN_120512 [Dreissena polymorpha]|uniref:Uncharacterized protein n=1 Tax=Dreissena polymorpha TaxID=45954 RepID=A0A9D4GNS5_DREPO|nr:hypothetical protein DPMN_120512 [Dreissena polymorpha]